MPLGMSALIADPIPLSTSRPAPDCKKLLIFSKCVGLENSDLVSGTTGALWHLAIDMTKFPAADAQLT
jgi:hypothetical protein